MPPFCEDNRYDDVDEDVDINADINIAAVEDIEADDGENVTNRMQELISDHIEWGTCPLCKVCGIVGNSCLECTNQ